MKRELPSWTVPVVGAAVAAVLSSGVTAAVVRARQPDVIARPGPWIVQPEQRDIAAVLVDPGPPYQATSAGSPVDAASVRRESPAEGLAALGFRRGWSRTWRTPAQDRVDAFVLEFTDSDGAAGYSQGIGRVARLLIKPQPFTVTGVPGSNGLADTVKDRGGHYAQVVVMHRGTRAVLLVFSDTSATPGPEVLTLAQRQYAALGS